MADTTGKVVDLMAALKDSLRKTHADFHAHLDECRQCREHPFALCSTGRELLGHTAGTPEKENG